MTLLEVLTAATDYLAKAGVPEARLNAEHLLAHTLGKKRLDLYMEFDRPLGETERAPLRELVRSRSQGKPLQHVLGSAAFFGREFICDPRGLIPRPETEQLVELCLAGLKAATGPLAILDCGTGSGVIAITLALEIPDAEVSATDLSQDALALAAENAAKLGAGDRIDFSEADLLPAGGGPFDLIAANLPYIPTGEIQGLMREVQHDPVRALDGGADGLDLIRRLVAAAPDRLRPGGRIALEIGEGQAGAVTAICREHNFGDITAHADYQGRQRFVIARHG